MKPSFSGSRVSSMQKAMTMASWKDVEFEVTLRKEVECWNARRRMTSFGMCGDTDTRIRPGIESE